MSAVRQRGTTIAAHPEVDEGHVRDFGSRTWVECSLSTSTYESAFCSYSVVCSLISSCLQLATLCVCLFHINAHATRTYLVQHVVFFLPSNMIP